MKPYNVLSVEDTRKFQPKARTALSAPAPAVEIVDDPDALFFLPPPPVDFIDIPNAYPRYQKPAPPATIAPPPAPVKPEPPASREVSEYTESVAPGKKSLLERIRVSFGKLFR